MSGDRPANPSRALALNSAPPPSFTGELYFLIVKFLENGPCSEAGEVLKKELAAKNLLPVRYDYRGDPHARTFGDLEEEYGSVPGEHLLNLCYNLCSVDPCAPTVRSLMSHARQVRAKARLHHLGYNLAKCVQSLRFGVSPSPGIWHERYLSRKFKKLRRTLGHLSSVYCLTFDRTGRLAFTGADDLLVKCWKVSDGRLLYTFRGGASEISDMTVSHDNKLLAVATLDKIARVWNIHNGEPVAVLSRHGGQLTALNFSAYVSPTGHRFLACTSGDGTASFWRYQYVNNKVQFEEQPTRYHEKSRPGKAKIICATFSPGGLFFCTGSADHNVRVYLMNCPEGPQRIMEDETHDDQVDSIQWCNGSDLRFVTGSSDGTARIWSYSHERWTSIVLNMSTGDNQEIGSSSSSSAQQTNQQQSSLEHDYVLLPFERDEGAGTSYGIRRRGGGGSSRLRSNLNSGTANGGNNGVGGENGGPFGRRGTRRAAAVNGGALADHEHDPVGPHEPSRAVGGSGRLRNLHTGPARGGGVAGGACRSNNNNNEGSSDKAVTMVQWSRNDAHVITAVADATLKVWDSRTGRLVASLLGHESLVFTLEPHPLSDNLLLSAGHDGYLKIWDIMKKTCVFSHRNMVDTQGHASVYDAKWSPDGTLVCATDSHGHLLFFGNGSSDSYDKNPTELFFHTDYRPLLRDLFHNVVDEQTQMLPHLMPPPLLIDSEGAPYPPHIQRLVRGRENSTNADALLPIHGPARNPVENQQVENAVVNVNFDDDDDDDEMARDGMGQQGRQLLPEEQQRSPSLQRQLPFAVARNFQLDNLVSQDSNNAFPLLGAPNGGSNGQGAAGPSRRPHGEGSSHRQEASGNAHNNVRGSSSGYKLVIIGENECASELEELRVEMEARSSQEYALYRAATFQNDDSTTMVGGHFYSSQQPKNSAKKKQSKSSSSRRTNSSAAAARNGGGGDPSSRSGRERERRTQDDDDDDEDEDDDDEASENGNNGNAEEDTSDCSLDESDFSSSESTTEVSSEHSDWGSDDGSNGQNAARSSSSAAKQSNHAETGRQLSQEHHHRPSWSSSSPGKKRSPKSSKKKRNAAKLCRERMSQPSEIGEEFQPSPWLMEQYPKRTPYFPQVGDVLTYFKQGHENYLDLVKKRSVYKVNPKEHQQFLKASSGNNKKSSSCVKDACLVKVVAIRYEIRPPRLCVLKLSVLNGSGGGGNNFGRPTGDHLTIKYHDMNDVVDFLVIHQTIAGSKDHRWKSGDRIRAQIDDRWWKGTVRKVSHQQQPGGSSGGGGADPFLSIRVKWDNGEEENLSPWDLEALDHDSAELPDGDLATSEELLSCLYSPTLEEWNGVGRESECVRISEALGAIMSLAIAEPFNYPVDLAAYPDYALEVEYPVDLGLVKARVDNRFYRRIVAFQHDIKYIFKNAAVFNRPKSDIVRNAKIISRIALEIAADTTKTKQDVSSMYHRYLEDFQWSSSSSSSGGEEEVEATAAADDDAVPGTSTSKRSPKRASGSVAAHRQQRKQQQQQQSSLNPKKWKQDCSLLLDDLMAQPFSQPFREPVSEIEFPDYHRYVATPMDLSTVRESLLISEYACPMDFHKDLNLIVKNSKTYNTMPNSKVIRLTNKMEEWIEDRMADIIRDWRRTRRRLTKMGAEAKNQGRTSPEEYRGKGKGVGKGQSNQIHNRNRRRPFQLLSGDEDDDDGSDYEASLSSKVRKQSRAAAAAAAAAAMAMSTSTSEQDTTTTTSLEQSRNHGPNPKPSASSTSSYNHSAEFRHHGQPNISANSSSYLQASSSTLEETRRVSSRTSKPPVRFQDMDDEDTDHHHQPFRASGRSNKFKNSLRDGNDDDDDDEDGEEESPSSLASGAGMVGAFVEGHSSSSRMLRAKRPKRRDLSFVYSEDEDDPGEKPAKSVCHAGTNDGMANGGVVSTGGREPSSQQHQHHPEPSGPPPQHHVRLHQQQQQEGPELPSQQDLELQQQQGSSSTKRSRKMAGLTDSEDEPLIKRSSTLSSSVTRKAPETEGSSRAADLHRFGVTSSSSSSISRAFTTMYDQYSESEEDRPLRKTQSKSAARSSVAAGRASKKSAAAAGNASGRRGLAATVSSSGASSSSAAAAGGGSRRGPPPLPRKTSSRRDRGGSNRRQEPSDHEENESESAESSSDGSSGDGSSSSSTANQSDVVDESDYSVEENNTQRRRGASSSKRAKVKPQRRATVRRAVSEDDDDEDDDDDDDEDYSYRSKGRRGSGSSKKRATGKKVAAASARRSSPNKKPSRATRGRVDYHEQDDDDEDILTEDDDDDDYDEDHHHRPARAAARGSRRGSRKGTGGSKKVKKRPSRGRKNSSSFDDGEDEDDEEYMHIRRKSAAVTTSRGRVCKPNPRIV